jgi:ATP-dependent DNA helicase RecG
VVKKRESQNVEFKESWRDDYMKWICGFANAQGGEIYIGVRDDGSVCGVDDAKRLLEGIPNKAVSLLGVVVDVDLLQIEKRDVVRIRVNSYSVPISYRGVYHYRSGATKQELTGTALQDFLFRKMGLSWDDVECAGATLTDIDERAVRYFLRHSVESGRMPSDAADLTLRELLEGLGLLSASGVLKNAAVLLFGKNPQRFFPAAQFKIGRFGHDETDLLFQDVVEGNLLQMADHVVEVLKSKYLRSPISYEGLVRLERLELPEAAFREVLFNAIVHRNYAGAAIQMKVWDDHVEVWNEGTLPIGFTTEMLANPHASRPRNRNIANVFYRAGFIEAWGRGIAKIANGFATAGLPAPAFAEFCGGMLVTVKWAEAKVEKVRNGGGNVRIESEKVRIEGEKVRIENALSAAGVSKPTREKAMSLYSEFGVEKEFGESVVVESLGLSRRGASRLISILRANGIVAHADGKGPGKYVFAAAAERRGE